MPVPKPGHVRSKSPAVKGSGSRPARTARTSGVYTSCAIVHPGQGTRMIRMLHPEYDRPENSRDFVRRGWNK